MTCREFPVVKKSAIKYLAYEYVLGQTLKMQFRPSQNKDRFGILPALRHILSKYESLIAENSITQTHRSQPGPSQDTSNSSSRKKGKEKEDNKGEDKPKFVPPRLFNLFPNPGLQWRFIKIDSQNITGIFPGAALTKEEDETLFSYIQRYFYSCFNFVNLRIKKLEDLQRLPANKGKMLLNGMEFFEEGDRTKMPLIIFGDGLENEDQTKFRGLRPGVSDKLYRQLGRREKLGKLLLLDVNVFRTDLKLIYAELGNVIFI
ncbi:hypothetical protein EDC94DRAFT_657383 [Helicostylum pulchrum]|nr:hypothetical protein EDC94DRAFT_657383 [Helicostylum pulchrum]